MRLPSELLSGCELLPLNWRAGNGLMCLVTLSMSEMRKSFEKDCYFLITRFTKLEMINDDRDALILRP